MGGGFCSVWPCSATNDEYDHMQTRNLQNSAIESGRNTLWRATPSVPSGFRRPQDLGRIWNWQEVVPKQASKKKRVARGQKNLCFNIRLL